VRPAQHSAARDLVDHHDAGAAVERIAEIYTAGARQSEKLSLRETRTELRRRWLYPIEPGFRVGLMPIAMRGRRASGKLLTDFGGLFALVTVAEDFLMQIANWMTRDPVCITCRDTLARAKELMDAGRFRRLPVIENDKLVGIITERDLRQHWDYLDSTEVDAAMTPDPITITPRVTAEDVARLMLQHKIGGLPVVENGKLVGIVSTSDLLRAFLNVVQAAEHIMDD
jgi:acetoin utilization protein AcuB